MVTPKNTLPDFFEVKIGSTNYELDTDTLISSLSHQYLSKNSNQNSFDSYDILFSLIKDEITEYLQKIVDDKNNFIDLFGNWSEEFRLFHNKKNEPFCRDINFNFSDGSKWSVKILDLMTLREDFDASKINYDDPILYDHKLLIDWVTELSWDNIYQIAEEIERPQPEPDYETEWKKCEKNIVFWEKTFNILDFFEPDDIIGLEEAPDDKPI